MTHFRKAVLTGCLLCLRLALIASDEEASGRLLAIHHDYKAKADAVDAETEASARVTQR
jgi:hypothetical protein